MEPKEIQDLLDEMVTTTGHKNKELFDWLYFFITMLTFPPHAAISGLAGSQGPKGLSGPPGIKGRTGSNGLSGKVLLNVFLYFWLYKNILNLTLMCFESATHCVKPYWRKDSSWSHLILLTVLFYLYFIFRTSALLFSYLFPQVTQVHRVLVVIQDLKATRARMGSQDHQGKKEKLVRGILHAKL